MTALEALELSSLVRAMNELAARLPDPESPTALALDDWACRMQNQLMSIIEKEED
jgi:hypothetical protein